MSNTIRAIGANGEIEAQAIRYGSPAEPDRSPTRDFFTPKTNLWLDRFGFPKPILLEHGVKPGTFGVSLGQWTAAKYKPDGVYLVGRLDTTHPRYPEIARDIQAGKYFLSSDSTLHLIKARPAPNNTHEILEWPLLTASLTQYPAEQRLAPVNAIRAAYAQAGLKFGARNSARDLERIQGAHDAAADIVKLLEECGATPIALAVEEEEEPETDPVLAMPMRSRALWLELDAIERGEREADRVARLRAELDAIERKVERAPTWEPDWALYRRYMQ